MIRIWYTVALMFVFSSCQSQSGGNEVAVGGPCEGCEALFEYGDRKLNPIDTIPEFASSEPKLKISGTVYMSDGETPAENIIIYLYQTNLEGVYEKKGNEEGWARRHGFIRSWLKTGKDGKYTFFTFRPGSYPGRSEPAHIHITVKEPNTNPYYLDDFLFDDDPLLTSERRGNLLDRGGSGILTADLQNGMLVATRDIVLGLNIPNYK